MKKLLLTTTALVSVYAGVAAAGMPDATDLKVTVGGSIEARAAFRSQKNEYLMANTGTSSAAGKNYKRGVTPANQNVGFDTVSAMHASVTGQHDAMKYGAQIGIQSTTRSQLSAGSDALDRTFIFMENDNMGRFEAGTNSGVSSSMRLGADRIARATGGIDGDFGNYVSLDTFVKDTDGNYVTAAVQESDFISGPVLYLTRGGSIKNETVASKQMEGDEKARKLSYYTPEYNGFQAGLSFTPDNRNSGQDYMNQLNDRSVNSSTKPIAKNALAAGLTWKTDLAADQSFKMSLVGESAKMYADPTDVVGTAKKEYKNISGAIFGAQYNYQNWAVAASYGNQGKSGYAKTNTISEGTKLKDAYFYTAGLAYVQGPVGTSLTYMHSDKNTNKMDIYSLGMDYQMAPGLLPYAEVTYFQMKQKTHYTNDVASNGSLAKTTQEYKNKGTAFILGTKINF